MACWTAFMRPVYALSHCFVYAPAHYAGVHSRLVTPHELIGELVNRSGKSVTQIAREMHQPTFQGTLHKFLSGLVREPSRTTAERISRYFRVPMESLYNDAAATRCAFERGLLPAPPSTTLSAREPQAPYQAGAAPLNPPISESLQFRVRCLSPAQYRTLLSVIETFLDSVAEAPLEDSFTS